MCVSKIRIISGVIPGRGRSAAKAESPESISPAGDMDSGLAATLRFASQRPGMTERFEYEQFYGIARLVMTAATYPYEALHKFAAALGNVNSLPARVVCEFELALFRASLMIARSSLF